jgi:chloramphenicol-sensitive protein RarD
MQQHHEQGKGVAVAFVTYGVWGLLTIYWKQLEHFDAFELIGWRVATAAAVMVLVLTVTRRWSGVVAVARDRRQLAVVATAAMFLTVNWTAYVWAVVHDDVLETALGYFIAPLGTVTVGVLVLHEPLRVAQKAALAMAAAAVVVLALSYGRVPWLALVIAASWTTYGYLKKQIPLTPVHSMAAESLVLLVPAVATITALADRADSIPRSADGPHLALALLTGVATVVPLMMFAYAAPRVPLTIIGPMQYLVPSINFIIGWVIYDEPMPGARLAGFALVWAGLVLLTLEAGFRARRARLSPAR